jgi:hypothetical protein
MQEEMWKDIPNYEGIYQASTLGRIRTVEGKTTHTVRHGERRWKSRIMKGRGSFNGGYRVGLWKDGGHRDWLVARLVATTFLGEPGVGETVNHKDGNRFNNSIDNLEWLSLADNIRHGHKTGLYKTKPVALLSEDGIERVFSSRKEAGEFLGKSHGYISVMLRLGKSTVRDACKNKYFIREVNGRREMSRTDEIRERLLKIQFYWELIDDGVGPIVCAGNDSSMGNLVEYGNTASNDDIVFIGHAPSDIDYLLSELDRVTRERDAAVEDLHETSADTCSFCKNYSFDRDCWLNDINGNCANWEYRMVVEESDRG